MAMLKKINRNVIYILFVLGFPFSVLASDDVDLQNQNKESVVIPWENMKISPITGDEALKRVKQTGFGKMGQIMIKNMSSGSLLFSRENVLFLKEGSTLDGGIISPCKGTVTNTVMSSSTKELKISDNDSCTMLNEYLLLSAGSELIISEDSTLHEWDIYMKGGVIRIRPSGLYITKGDTFFSVLE